MVSSRFYQVSAEGVFVTQSSFDFCHHLFAARANFRNTVFRTGLSGKSRKASRRRRITLGLVSRKKVLISFSRLSAVTSALVVSAFHSRQHRLGGGVVRLAV